MSAFQPRRALQTSTFIHICLLYVLAALLVGSRAPRSPLFRFTAAMTEVRGSIPDEHQQLTQHKRNKNNLYFVYKVSKHDIRVLDRRALFNSTLVV